MCGLDVEFGCGAPHAYEHCVCGDSGCRCVEVEEYDCYAEFDAFCGYVGCERSGVGCSGESREYYCLGYFEVFVDACREVASVEAVAVGLYAGECDVFFEFECDGF